MVKDGLLSLERSQYAQLRALAVCRLQQSGDSVVGTTAKVPWTFKAISLFVNAQVLPFCSDETLDQLEKNLTGMPSMTQLLNQGLTAQQITDRILEGLGSSSSGETIVPRWAESSLFKDLVLLFACTAEQLVMYVQIAVSLSCRTLVCTAGVPGTCLCKKPNAFACECVMVCQVYTL